MGARHATTASDPRLRAGSRNQRRATHRQVRQKHRQPVRLGLSALRAERAVARFKRAADDGTSSKDPTRVGASARVTAVAAAPTVSAPCSHPEAA